MINLKQIQEQILIFKSYLNIESLDLTTSEWYSLFPLSRDEKKEELRLQWPGKFPNSENHGVYLIFSEKEELLYIGKASMHSSIGNRLGSYFSYKDDKITCNVSHTWTKNPQYIVTIKVQKDYSFVAPALEEYLIKHFGESLPDNKVGTKKQPHNKSLNRIGTDTVPPG